MSSEFKVIIRQVLYSVINLLHAHGHLPCGLLGMTSPCLCRYLRTLGRVPLYRGLLSEYESVGLRVGVGEDTDVRLKHTLLLHLLLLLSLSLSLSLSET